MNSRILIASLVFLMWAGTAQACSCRAPRTAQDVVRTTKFIFWGRAVSKSDVANRRYYQVEVWTGKGTVPVTLVTAQHSAACGIDLPIGKRVLIGAGVNNGVYRVNLCTMLAIEHFHAEIVEIVAGCKPFEPCP